MLGYAMQLLDRDAFPFVVPASCLRRFAPHRGRAGKVFLPRVGSKCALAPGLFFDAGLRLVIGGEHVWFVLAPERLGLLRRRIEQTGALADRLSGGVGHKGQLPVGRRSVITQEELGARIGIDPTYISRVEGGRINLRWGTLQRFLRALDATHADLAVEVERHAD